MSAFKVPSTSLVSVRYVHQTHNGTEQDVCATEASKIFLVYAGVLRELTSMAERVHAMMDIFLFLVEGVLFVQMEPFGMVSVAVSVHLVLRTQERAAPQTLLPTHQLRIQHLLQLRIQHLLQLLHQHLPQIQHPRVVQMLSSLVGDANATLASTIPRTVAYQTAQLVRYPLLVDVHAPFRTPT